MDDKDLIGSRVYCCFKCRNVVALHDNIVDKYFLVYINFSVYPSIQVIFIFITVNSELHKLKCCSL